MYLYVVKRRRARCETGSEDSTLNTKWDRQVEKYKLKTKSLILRNAVILGSARSTKKKSPRVPLGNKKTGPKNTSLTFLTIGFAYFGCIFLYGRIDKSEPDNSALFRLLLNVILLMRNL